jgi:putative tryptophan/tyrosine transport system substrate-binding protein
MRRRDFIAGLSGAAAWPFFASAQQRALPVVGFLGAGSALEFAPFLAAFRQGLKDAGFVERQNVAFEYRWAEGQYDRLPAMAGELVERHVAVIAALDSTPAALAAKAAARTIPVVFTAGADPVKYGLAASLNRPGGNATGVVFLTSLLVQKQFEVLHDLLPDAREIALLVNPGNPYADEGISDVEAAARILGRKVMVVRAASEDEIDAAFEAVVRRRANALHVPGDALFFGRRDKLVALSERHAIPAIYAQREFVDLGGLMSYGANVADADRIAGGYVGRILKGDNPANLPVQLETKVEFVINMKTAKALGLTFPLKLLGRADAVIE